MRRLLPIALLLAGCVGTAVPQPPNLMPVDPELVVGSTQESPGPLELAGLPGAAEPGAQLFIWDLAAATPPSTTAVADDGSFSVLVPTPLGALRVQVRDGEDRSEPVDISPSADRSILLARRGCLLVDRELFLGESGVASLALVNDCDAEASLVSSRLRVGDLTLDAPSGLVLPPGTQAELVVSADDSAAAEDIVLLELALEGTTYLYPVTVSAPAR